ncbi:MAG: cytochrome c biogenesis protein ResB [Candidatus Eremiobacterota bacterium]
MSALKNVYRFCASIKLAVVELLALAVILAVATFYESLYDTRTAQHLVYSSGWFAAFLAVLWVNIFCATAIRYPWKAYQTGFVITHVGILTLLVGSLLTMMFGVDGQMAVEEGGKSDRVTLDRPVLLFGDEGRSMEEIEAEFRWDPPREGREVRYPLPNGCVAVVDRYLHRARPETRYVASPGGDPAVRLQFDSSRIHMDQWLTPTMGTVELGPAQVRFSLASEAEAARLLKGLPPGPERGEIQLLIQDEPFRVPVTRLLEGAVEVGDGYRVRVLRHLPDARVEDNQLVSRSDKPLNPCVELEIRNREGSLETYYLFAALPQLNTKFRQTGPPFPIRLLYSFDPPQAEKKHSLDLILTPSRKLFYRLSSGRSGEFRMQEKVATGWMDIQISLKDFVSEARSETTYHPVELPKGQKEGPPPAIRMRLEGGRSQAPFWLQQGDVQEVRGPENKPFLIGYSLETVPVGFELELLDFEIGYDPGTRNPASYRSTVRVEGREQVVQMNEPLQKNGFTLFQSSYQEVPDGPWISVFSVARDPGIVWKYTGSILLVGGIFTMFYLKPYLTGRRKYLAGLNGGPIGPAGPESE